MIPAHAVTGYLADHGFPDAGATLTGIRGTGRVLWVVARRSAEHAGPSLVSDWIEQARTDAAHGAADLGVLVTPHDDYGPARVASWWAHADVGTLSRVMRGRLALPAELSSGVAQMYLSTAVLLARAAGYGTPLGGEVAA